VLPGEERVDAPVRAVHGIVTTGEGWPMPGATVTLVGEGGRQAGRAVAGADGHFSVRSDAHGTVTVIVAAAGVDPFARTLNVSAHAPTDLGVITLGDARRRALPAAGRWEIDPAHTVVRARARHLGLSTVEGRFTAFTGAIEVAAPIEGSTVDVRIAAASIDTGNAERDAHLRSADFLDAARFPALTFRGDRVQRLTDERWTIGGTLTIRDITRPVALDVAYLGTGPDPWGGTRVALTATTQLARRDYEMTWNMGLPGGFVLVGPTLQVDLAVQAVRAEPKET
jgi:polyisoprenoid-binding protein YceI